jgi:hypothetical protein
MGMWWLQRRMDRTFEHLDEFKAKIKLPSEIFSAQHNSKCNIYENEAGGSIWTAFPLCECLKHITIQNVKHILLECKETKYWREKLTHDK